ncbi:hypothetical protein FKW77_008991 [Venturia effusa]|uniref:Uncharacterized protein n=1 Tax=Venturia effusa TaxID=50376 RepID=A0A517KX50_9PEZI|nr:hypothetical protein FKW77_008991 [Venturia effusa]
MMQKWRIRNSIGPVTRRSSRPPPQCAFSTSRSCLDDEQRPRSNRQASAKAGRLIANLNTRGAPERSRDPNFGLRGLKPYDDRAGTATANTANQPVRIRRVEMDYGDNSNPARSPDRPSSNRPSPDRLSSNRTSPDLSFSDRPSSNRASSDLPSSNGPPRRDYQSGQAAASKSRGGVRFGRHSASDQRGEGRYVGRDYRGGNEAFAATEEEEVDLQALVEEELRLSTPPQEEWEILDKNGNILDDEDDDEEWEDEDDLEELDIYSGKDADAPDRWEQSAYKGMEMTLKEINPGPQPFNPKRMKAEELHTAFITTGAGELGVAAAAKQAMGRFGRRADIDYQYDAELASRLYRGELVRFRDAEEKKRVMWMAEEFASNTANRIMEKKGEWEPKIDVGFVPLPEKAKDEIAGKAMRGIYPMVPTVTGELARAGMSDQKKTMAHLRRSVLLNETYSPAQGKSMVDFIAKMWPVENRSQQSQPGKRTDA